MILVKVSIFLIAAHFTESVCNWNHEEAQCNGSNTNLAKGKHKLAENTTNVLMDFDIDWLIHSTHLCTIFCYHPFLRTCPEFGYHTSGIFSKTVEIYQTNGVVSLSENGIICDVSYYTSSISNKFKTKTKELMVMAPPRECGDGFYISPVHQGSFFLYKATNLRESPSYRLVVYYNHWSCTVDETKW